MSNRTFEEQLRDALVDLTELMELERPPDPTQLPKEKKDIITFYAQHYTGLYTRYLTIIRKLEECYDQILQPQKREDVKAVLESVIQRFLEIRQVLVRVCGEYMDLEDVLVDMKLQLEDLEIVIPRYFIEDSKETTDRRDLLIDALMAQHNIDQTPWKDPFEDTSQMSVEQAILMIQTNERGRQSRQSYRFKKQLRNNEERIRKVVEFGELELDMDEAAVKIQKIWRGYAAKRKVAAMYDEELVFLGMAPTYVDPANDPLAKLEKAQDRRKLQQSQNKQELELASAKMREKVIKEEGPRIMENMHDEILEKVILLRQLGGKVPNFPTEEEGGSAAFLRPATAADLQKEEQERKAKEEKAAADKKGKGKGKTSAPAKKSGTKKKEPEEAPKPKVIVDIPTTKADIVNTVTKLVQVWQTRDNELDFGKKPDMGLLRQHLMNDEANGVMKMLRKQVDALVREELGNFNVQTKTPTTTKKKSPVKKKKRSKSAGSSGSASAAKKVDPVKLETERAIATEAMLSEMIEAGLVVKYPKVKIRDYIGTHRLLGTLLKDWSEPSIGQVRQCVSELILPLGTRSIHLNSPHVKAVMLYGPQGSGKTMLMHAICTEVGALLIDLSPQNIDGKYEGLKPTSFMVKVAFQLAKDLQPAVIYINDIEQVFPAPAGKGKKKKKPPASRIAKELLAQIEQLAPGDRVLVVANSRQPWEGDVSQFVSLFSRVIYTSRPEYSSRTLLWRTLIEKTSGQPVPDDLDIATLAHISDGYTSGAIHTVVMRVLTARRIQRIELRPLETNEFIGPLTRINPTFKEIDQRFRTFTDALPPYLRKLKAEDLNEEKPAENNDKAAANSKKGRTTSPKRKK